MSEETSNGKLLSEFPDTPYSAWREQAEAQLKGAPFEKKLVTKSYEGIDVQPIYVKTDATNIPYTDSWPGFAPYLRGTQAGGNQWYISQELPYSTAERFNTALKYDLARGQTAINLRLDQATLRGVDPDEAEVGEVGVDGVSLATVDDVAKALADLDLSKIPLFVQASSAALPTTALLIAMLKKAGQSPAKLSGAIEMDPLGTLVSQGKYPRSISGGYEVMASLLQWALTNAPQLKIVTVHGQPYAHGGANAVQELAFTLATGVEYLREMIGRDIPVDAVAQRLRFSLSIGSNYFMELAKLRAARVVWAKVVKAFGGNEESQKLALHGRTSSWNKTVYDPYVNMLRTTTEAFAGAAAGCDSLHVTPFDEAVRQPNQLGRRIARNTQLILQEESNLTRIVDPAGGAWYVESITNELARKAWALFQMVEEQGGMVKALQAGFPQAEIEETVTQRTTNIATRKDVFLGTNKYANLLEKPLNTDDEPDYKALQAKRAKYIANYRTALDGEQSTMVMAKLAAASEAQGAHQVEAAIEAATAGASLGELAKALRKGDDTLESITPIRQYRGAELFESLRATSETYAATHGTPPIVFLANMGPIPQHKPRADFSTDFFQIAGFTVITNNGFETPSAAAQAALDSGAGVVVICSTDATYPDIVPPLTKAIKSTKPETTILLAGYPKKHIEAFKTAGVDEFIHLRANAYEILSNLQAKLPQ